MTQWSLTNAQTRCDSKCVRVRVRNATARSCSRCNHDYPRLVARARGARRFHQFTAFQADGGWRLQLFSLVRVRKLFFLSSKFYRLNLWNPGVKKVRFAALCVGYFCAWRSATVYPIRFVDELIDFLHNGCVDWVEGKIDPIEHHGAAFWVEVILAWLCVHQYMSGFGNEFQSEALPNALPKGQV